jgi:hypothetical protein
MLGIAMSWFVFFMWVPRLGSHSHQEAVALYGAQNVPDCDAIAVNHGTFTCISWGIPSSDPWAFAGLTIVLVSGFGFLAITRIAHKGFFSATFSEAVGLKINAIRLRYGFGVLPLPKVYSVILGGLVMGVLAAIILVSALLTHVGA